MGGQERNDEIHRPVSDSHYGKLLLEDARECAFYCGYKKAPDCAEAGLFGFAGLFLLHHRLPTLPARKVVISCVIVLFAGVPFLIRVFGDEH